MSRLTWRALVALGAASLAGGVSALPALASGSAGQLDHSWNGTGYTTTSFGSASGAYSFADGVTVREDGHVLVVGGFSDGAGTNVFALARYRANGTLDSSFGSGGKMTTNFQGYDLATAVAPEGNKYVVVGYTSPDGGTTFDFAVARYLKNGSLDTSFGSSGKVITSFGGGYDFANAVALSEGKILVAGVSRADTPGNNNFILARYTDNGTLDTSFGTGGYVLTDCGHNGASGNSLALVEGRAVVAGYANGASHSVFALARYRENGALDSSFGSGGKVTTDFGSDAFGLHVAADGDRIAVFGKVFDGTTDDFAVAMYGQHGSPVTGFNGGRVTLDLGADETAYSGGFGAHDTVVAVGDSCSGCSGTPTSDQFAVARWTKDGVLDSSFGGGSGYVLTTIGSQSAAFAAGFGPDGKIVAAGYSDNDFAVARYLVR